MHGVGTVHRARVEPSYVGAFGRAVFSVQRVVRQGAMRTNDVRHISEPSDERADGADRVKQRMNMHDVIVPNVLEQPPEQVR